MMRMTVLASGSKGNSTVISSARTRVLVDAGLSCRELLKRMSFTGEDPSQLDAILITHEHQDHIAGLSVLARRLNIPVFFTEPTHRAWVRMLTPRTTMTYAKWLDHVQREKEARASAVAARARNSDLAAELSAQSEAIANISAEAAALNRSDDPNATLELPVELDEEDLCGPESRRATQRPDPTYLPAVEYFHSGTQFSIGDIDITPFTIPHDAADPCGFVFESEGIRMALATDLGASMFSCSNPTMTSRCSGTARIRGRLSSASSPASAIFPITPPLSSSRRTTTAGLPGSFSATSPKPTTPRSSSAWPPSRHLATSRRYWVTASF
jgi:L-ascorbate metabolism protein UlaG (beta-lactamase superfamily)